MPITIPCAYLNALSWLFLCYLLCTDSPDPSLFLQGSLGCEEKYRLNILDFLYDEGGTKVFFIYISYSVALMEAMSLRAMISVGLS